MHLAAGASPRRMAQCTTGLQSARLSLSASACAVAATRPREESLQLLHMRRGRTHLVLAALPVLVGYLGSLHCVTAARQCYTTCMEIDPTTKQFTGEATPGTEAVCCTNLKGCGSYLGSYSGVIPYGHMEDWRCIAAMRKEPLEVYKWGEIPPKPDLRTLSEKIVGLDHGIRNRLCCKVDACSIADYRDCKRQQQADLEVLLAGRRLETADRDPAYLRELHEVHKSTVLDRLRKELSGQQQREN